MTDSEPLAPRSAGVQIKLVGDPTKLKPLGGSNFDSFNTVLINQAVGSLWKPANLSAKEQEKRNSMAAAVMHAIGPRDEIEGMLAAQMVAMHHASMEASRRAMLPDQPFEIVQGYRKSAANSTRTFIELLAALDRRRGKGTQQKVTVEHVHVHAGGQAIVGNIEPGDRGGGGGRPKQKVEPRAPAATLAHDPAVGAGRAALRRKDPERVPMQGAGDAA